MDSLLKWFQTIFYGFSEAANWFVTPITIGDFTITPLALCGGGALIVFLGIAVTKWFIS